MDLISKHIANPVNFGRVLEFTHSGAARGPDHEDFIAFQAKVVRNRILDIKWQGTGCIITLVAASILAEGLQGKQLIVLTQLVDNLLAPLTKYNSSSCLNIVREAIDCCFDWDAKERGKCRQVMTPTLKRF